MDVRYTSATRSYLFIGAVPDSLLQLPALRNDCPDLTFSLPSPHNLLASTSVRVCFCIFSAYSVTKWAQWYPPVKYSISARLYTER
jgi:hypothetical protein